MTSKSAKVALITGAARRIGAEIARVLHAQGMNIVIHYNFSETEALQLSDELNHLRSQSAIALQADLMNVTAVKDLLHQAAQTWNRLDVLVNNASRFFKTNVEKTTEEDWHTLLDSNLKAPFFLAQSAVPYLKQSKGCIINIADIHAERPVRDYPVYCISKSGLIMLTKSLAKELGPDIRVNAISPGAILWPEGENNLTSELKQKILDRITLARHGTPSDIAKAVSYLALHADYVTGQVLAVDGGRSLVA